MRKAEYLEQGAACGCVWVHVPAAARAVNAVQRGRCDTLGTRKIHFPLACVSLSRPSECRVSYSCTQDCLLLPVRQRAAPPPADSGASQLCQRQAAASTSV